MYFYTSTWTRIDDEKTKKDSDETLRQTSRLCEWELWIRVRSKMMAKKTEKSKDEKAQKRDLRNTTSRQRCTHWATWFYVWSNLKNNPLFLFGSFSFFSFLLFFMHFILQATLRSHNLQPRRQKRERLYRSDHHHHPSDRKGRIINAVSHNLILCFDRDRNFIPVLLEGEHTIQMTNLSKLKWLRNKRA